MICMKKNVIVIGIIMLCILLLSACTCEHNWLNATCELPKTCSECGETEGEAIGHNWNSATCKAPKTCSECSATEGSAIGHDWNRATCTSPKNCSVCGKTVGGKISHTFSKEIPTTQYLCSTATVESPAKYYYACVYCEKKGTNTYTYGGCAQSLWVHGLYVDNFGDKTDEWYICPRNEIKGTFCNTATTDSSLLVEFLYDCNGDITIFLYEYAKKDNLVKNGSSKYSEYYKITIRDDTGTTIDVRGAIYPGNDRISIVDSNRTKVFNMMKSAKTMRFFIQNEDSPATTYRFDIDLTDFLYVLDIVEE